MTAIRRLAAILAADVAGCSRLIGSDEGGTLQALKAIRAELIDPTIAAHNGRLVTMRRRPYAPALPAY
jgi:adenylate cyclase